MTRWQPPTRRYSIALLAAALIAGSALALVPGETTGAEADVSVENLDVAGVDRTVSGNVSDVRLATTLGYDHAVPDATRRLVKLKAGPSKGDLELVAFTSTTDPDGSASGSVSLAGSVLDHPDLSAADFQPETAGNRTQELVVQAVIEVRRDSGDPVTHTTTDTVTVTLADDATLEATIGGTGNVTVETDA